VTFFWLFIFENDVKVISKKQNKKYRKQQDPDPLGIGMDPRIRIRTKISRIRNTGRSNWPWSIYPRPNPRFWSACPPRRWRPAARRGTPAGWWPPPCDRWGCARSAPPPRSTYAPCGHCSRSAGSCSSGGSCTVSNNKKTKCEMWWHQVIKSSGCRKP